MSTARPANRQRNGGGRALMLLGVLLAVLSGVLVIYIVSQATTSAGATEQLVVATVHIPYGTDLNTGLIPQDFAVKSYPLSLVPANAYIFVSQDNLNARLANTVAVVDIYPGDIYLNGDTRFQPVGSIAAGSITGSNPNVLKAGDVLYPMDYANPTNGARNLIVAGDQVDVIVTECGAPWDASGACVTQTTLQNV